MTAIDDLPILYSFRRCPYAMRARLVLSEAGIKVALREVVLRDKPADMLEKSSKGTVPVLVLPDGTVIDESEDIIHWALTKQDPNGWAPKTDADKVACDALFKDNDGTFKTHLDRYKYANRYAGAVASEHRTGGMVYINDIEARLNKTPYLAGASFGLADAVVAPFVRQFANTDRAWFDAQDLPALHAWLGSFLDSERFKAIMAKYPQWREGDQPTVFPA